MITILIVLFLCFVLSAYFSGSEMAFTSANKLKFRKMAEEGDSRAKQIVQLQKSPQHFLTSVLIGNNIANIGGTALLTYGLDIHFGIRNEWIVTGIMAPLLLILGEMVPKDYCRIKSQDFLLRYSGSLGFMVKVFHFPTLLILKVMNFFLSIFGQSLQKNIFVSEKELRSLIEESNKSGVLDDHEKQIVDRILDFERIRIDSVMTPLAKVAQADIHTKVGQVKELAAKTGAGMILIYEEDPSIVMGMINVFDLLFEENDRKGLKDYLRSPIFLQGTTTLETAFLSLQEKRQSYAVVTDAYGEAQGVVPIEKLLVV